MIDNGSEERVWEFSARSTYTIGRPPGSDAFALVYP